MKHALGDSMLKNEESLAVRRDIIHRLNICAVQPTITLRNGLTGLLYTFDIPGTLRILVNDIRVTKTIKSYFYYEELSLFSLFRIE